MASEIDIVLKLIESVRDDIEAGRQSRAVVHARLDEVVDRLGKIETALALAGTVDDQVRQELDDLKKTVADNAAAAAPTLDEWKRIRAIGLGLVGLLAVGGVSVGAALAWAGETVVNAVRSWLRIS